MTRDQLMALTVPELRKLAAQHGLTQLAKWKKDQLVETLVPLIMPPPTPAQRHQVMAPEQAAPQGSSARPGATPALHQGPDPGLPIPERYGVDRIVLMVQDPTHVFAYWEVAAETYHRVHAAAGGETTSVLVIESRAGTEQREVDLRGGNYYLAVAPSTAYQARLALRDRNGVLHPLAPASNPVTTPAAGPSWRTDESWMAVQEHWEEWLAKAAPGSSESSLARFARRRIETRAIPVGADSLGEIVPIGGAALSEGGMSSAVLAKSWSSAALGASGELSSWGLLSSHAFSSHVLSSHSLSSHSRWSGEPTYQQVSAGLTAGSVNQAPATVVPGAPAAAPWADVPASATAAPAPGPSAPLTPMRPGQIRGLETVKPNQGRKRPS